MEEIEIWKSLYFLGYPDYEVSNWGNIKSLNYNRTGKERLLKLRKNNYGYFQVDLYKNTQKKTFRVHKLVALAFIPNDNPIEKTEINHLDENKENNHVSNLEWVTPKENSNHATRNERIRESHKGKKRSEETKHKISETKRIPILQYTLDGVFIRYWDSVTQASEKLNIHKGNITKVCKGKRKTSGGFLWSYKE